MEDNLEQDIEIQLQEELKRLKKAVEYIEQAKSSFAQSQQILDNTQAKFVEMSNLHEILKQEFQSSISDIENKTINIHNSIENKFANQFSSIQQDILKLSNNKSMISEIDNIKNELSKQEKLIETNLSKQNSEQNIIITNLTKQIKSSKTFNYVLLILLIITLITVTVK